MTLVSPRPPSSPAPGKSGRGAWSGARGSGRGAHPRARGPRSRCGRAPLPLRGPGYSPQRCSAAAQQSAQTPLPPAPHPPRSHRPLGRCRRRRPRRRRRGARPLSRTPPWPRTRLCALASLSNRSAAGPRDPKVQGPEVASGRFAALPHRPDPLPSWGGDPRVWLPCWHLAPGKHVTTRHCMASLIASLRKGRSPPWSPPGGARAPAVERAAALSRLARTPSATTAKRRKVL
ncbi:uncharacterized protein [Equus caballus]|uniref:uncharacterized protein n=1 Tax=Equus caballus TaxID=9796 RepID=UPI0038B343B8